MDRGRIEQALRALVGIDGGAPGGPLSVVDATASTNEDARQAAAAGAGHGAAFVADQQSAGRGRQGRLWYSPAGRNIYLSVVLWPQVAAAALAPISLVAGLAVARVVDRALAASWGQVEPPRRAMVKWPNDVFLEGRKVAGVLVEASTGLDGPPLVVVGVGLNVLGDAFPPEIEDTATSLAGAGGRDLERETICAALIGAIVARANDFALQGLTPLLAELRERDFLRGREVDVAGVSGKAEGFDDHGRLLLRGSGGSLRAVHSGEVSWR